MSQTEDIRRALYHRDEAPSKREIRAARTRAEALSPVRIVLRLLTMPVLALSVALSIYIRTSDYDPPEALAHLVARVGCDAANSIGLAPSYRGGLGYHARNDMDGDGVACNEDVRLTTVAFQTNGFSNAETVQDTSVSKVARMAGGAKFVKP